MPIQWAIRFVVTALVAALASAIPATAAQTERISVSSSGEQADGHSPGEWGYQAPRVAMSEHGRLVAFFSDASNLVAGDTNRAADVFVRDRKRGTTTRISVSSAGAQADGPSFGLDMTPDGRYVVFCSRASNLVPGDTNAVNDIFVHDRRTRTTARVSVSTAGVQSDWYASAEPVISANGRYVAFASGATTLVTPDRNQGSSDIYVHDRATATTSRVNVSTGGTQANYASGSPDISAGGRLVVFASSASNLLDGRRTDERIWMHDRRRGTTYPVARGTDGYAAGALYLAARGNIVLYDRGTDVLTFARRTRRIRCMACWDEPTAATWSDPGGISADGRVVAFDSEKPGLVAGDTNGVTDAFVRRRSNGGAIRVSVDTDSTQVRRPSSTAGVSPDGRFAAFFSKAHELVTSDTNRRSDLFVRGPLPVGSER